MPSRKRGLVEFGGDPGPRKRKTNNSGKKDETGKVRLHWFRDENTSQHHTNEYENHALVLRRGEIFRLGMTFEGLKFPEILKAGLRFCIEPQPEKFRDKIGIPCNIKDSFDQMKWGMKIVDQKSDELKVVVDVNIPVTAAVGRYSVHVVVPDHSSEYIQLLDDDSLKPLKKPPTIIILFNAWNKDDDVYIQDEKSRKEYVLNDTGLIYRGNAYWSDKGISPLLWDFGQFEEDILDCVLSLLENDRRIKKRSLKTLEKRKSPVWVARILSAMLNCQDDDGVLEGNWSGNYEDGISPLKWNGSVEIFDLYYKTGQPVKYGQCWVFSGIMTTALRALGIPARSVTNFSSAHDTDQTMTIDAFYDENGEKIDDLCDDSVWNFHVWNEIYTKRRDLPDNKYDGWQAVDATPQEESLGLSQMGPAPLKAVKEGEIYAGYDTGFVFGEVNADRIRWITKSAKDNVIGICRRDTRSVGKFISTKKVGRNEREDVTGLYKYPEYSAEERKAFKTAYSFGQGPKNWAGFLNIEEEGKDLTIELSTEGKETPQNGDSFTCSIDVKNTSNRKLSVNLTGVISSVQYTGEVKMLIKRQKFEGIQIDGGKKATRKIFVDHSEYLDKVSEHNCIKFVVVAKVLETGKQYVDDTILQLVNKDCIEVKISPSPLKVGQKSKVQVIFSNPLPMTLSGLTFTVEGARLTKPIKRSYKQKLRNERRKKMWFYIKPRKTGLRTLLVDVDTDQAQDFKTSLHVNVVQP